MLNLLTLATWSVEAGMSGLSGRVRARGAKVLNKSERGGSVKPAGIMNPLQSARTSDSVRVLGDQMVALSVVYHSSPVVMSIRNVLHSHLLEGGVLVKKKGIPVDLQALLMFKPTCFNCVQPVEHV